MAALHIVINGWYAGETTAGSGQYVDHLLTHLPRLPNDLKLTLLVPADNMRTPLEYEGVAIHAIKTPGLPGNLRKLWWEQVAVPLAARQLGADVLWVPHWAAPAWQPCPVAVTVHDLIPALLPAYRGSLLNKLYTALVSWTARRAASIITVSHASAQDIIQHLRVPAERVHVVYHGPNQEGAPRPTAQDFAAARQRYQLPERYFLYLGGYDMRKNVKRIVAAYARYLALGGDPAIKLVLAGNAPLHDSAFAPDPHLVVSELGLEDAVHFCGRVAESDKAALYAQATAYLFPSLYEGFGMMVLEAMAAGTPIITSGNSPSSEQ
jgi:glycosyltransferase involved in cell wall biosynthesis